MLSSRIIKLLIVFCCIQYIGAQQCTRKKLVSFSDYEDGRLIGQGNWTRGASCSEIIEYDSLWDTKVAKSGSCFNGQGTYMDTDLSGFLQDIDTATGIDRIYGLVRNFAGCCNKGTRVIMSCLNYGLFTGNHDYNDAPRLSLSTTGTSDYLVSSEGSVIGNTYTQGVEFNYDERKIKAILNSSSQTMLVEAEMNEEFIECFKNRDTFGFRMDGMGGGGIMDDIYTESCPNSVIPVEPTPVIPPVVEPENPTEYLSNYECYSQIRRTISQTETDYFITATANTDNCPPNTKYRLETRPSDVIVSPVEATFGNSFSIQINSGILYKKYLNQEKYTVSVASIFTLFFDNRKWYSATKVFTWDVKRNTITNNTIVSAPVDVNYGEQTNEVETDSNLVVCSDTECKTSKKDWILDDEITLRVSPNDEIPDGLILGTVISVTLNDKLINIETQGRYSDKSLWVVITLNTVCDDCILNITSSVIPDTIKSSRRVLSVEGANSYMSSIQVINVNQTNPTVNETPEKGLNLGAIIGGASGGLILIAVIAFFIKRRFYS